MTHRHGVCPCLLIPALALAPACSRVENPATGETEYTTLSPEQERRLGAQEHPRILQQFGGAYPDEELQAYVQAVGDRMAANSDQPDAEFTFTLLDSEVPNAFALPGGYVYITRGLLALAETEAEVAGVLGHEIGHVTARHTAQRQTRATGAGAARNARHDRRRRCFGGEVAGRLAQEVAGVGAQAYLASYSRDQEFQADRARGWLHDGRRLRPGGRWRASSRSSTPSRRSSVRSPAATAIRPRAGSRPTRARSTGCSSRPTRPRPRPGATQRIGRADYLARIDGLIYGEDPGQGLVRGRQFVHPDLGFAFAAPQGFELQNTPAGGARPGRGRSAADLHRRRSRWPEPGGATSPHPGCSSSPAR